MRCRVLSLLLPPAKKCLPESQPETAPKNLPERWEAESSVPALQHRELQEVSAAFPHLLQFN